MQCSMSRSEDTCGIRYTWSAFDSRLLSLFTRFGLCASIELKVFRTPLIAFGRSLRVHFPVGLAFVLVFSRFLDLGNGNKFH